MCFIDDVQTTGARVQGLIDAAVALVGLGSDVATVEAAVLAVLTEAYPECAVEGPTGCIARRARDEALAWVGTRRGIDGRAEYSIHGAGI